LSNIKLQNHLSGLDNNLIDYSVLQIDTRRFVRIDDI